MFYTKNGKLFYGYEDEKVCIEAWGKDTLRVRATKNRDFTAENWALEEDSSRQGEIVLYKDEGANDVQYVNMYAGKDNSYGSIKNGKLKAVINADGVISFYSQEDKLLLKEHWRRLKDETSMPLNIYGREYRDAHGDNYRIITRFTANEEEKIYGMGQYQQKQLNMKGCMLELAQRNSQITVPFYISNIGYGFLWNNPAVGRVTFANNGTEWTLDSTKQLDYLVIAGDTPSEIEEKYMELTGKAPMMPEYGLGFWQSKLRYRTQEELLEVARKYKELEISLDVIVADFFHWTQQGEYRFDPAYWPDVPGMCRELEEMGTKLMVSVWPTVDYRSCNFHEMLEKGFLVKTEKGVKVNMLCGGNEVFFDATNEEARAYVWEKIKENYWDKGARLFWLDVAEPEYTTYEFENYRYALGSVLETGNIYPRCYLQGFYDGMKKEGDENPISLVRSAWIGSARYGGLVWSGDIVSSFECLNRQVRAGLSMAIAGIPWWTTDIGGFHGADVNDTEFHTLFVRWFEYGCFCPVMRLHGNRNPQIDMEGEGVGSGSPNEIWSFGEEVYQIAKRYILLRERLRNYTRAQMRLAHEKGVPVMRPLFYDYPEDKDSWDVDDAYMFGPDLYVAPVLKEDSFERKVYLPSGSRWLNAWTGEAYTGGESIRAAAPLEQIPVFVREGAEVFSAFHS